MLVSSICKLLNWLSCKQLKQRHQRIHLKWFKVCDYSVNKCEPVSIDQKIGEDKIVSRAFRHECRGR